MRASGPLLVAASLALGVTSACAGSNASPERRAVRAGGDWTRFGYDAARRNSGPASTGITPAREKIGPALNYSRGLVLAATGGYVGDAPPYQGHVVAISAASGRIGHVWNALCSDRRSVMVPRTCPESGSAIWARSGVVVDPATRRLLVATGDGRFDGRRYWGDSVL